MKYKNLDDELKEEIRHCRRKNYKKVGLLKNHHFTFYCTLFNVYSSPGNIVCKHLGTQVEVEKGEGFMVHHVPFYKCNQMGGLG